MSDNTSNKHIKLSRGERAASLAVLAVLLGVAYWLYLTQFNLNPALTQRPAPLAQPKASGPVKAFAAPKGFDLASLAEDRLSPISGPEYFTPDTLYHKINGKADLYLQAGFKSLTSQRLALKGKDELWCELLLYEQASSEQAFAVYSQQRRPDARQLKYHKKGYRSQNALYLTQGKYYLEIVAASPSLELKAALDQAAKAFIKSQGGELQEPKPKAAPKPEAKPQAKSGPAPKMVGTGKPVPKAVAKPDAKPADAKQAKPSAKVAPQAPPRPQAASKPGAPPKPEAAPKPKTDPIPQAPPAAKAAKAKPPAKPLDMLSLLPEPDQEAGSATLIAKNAFGFSAMDKVYAARYKLKDAEALLFISRRESNQAANKLMQDYLVFLIENDGLLLPEPPAPKGAQLVDVLGLFELVVVRGRYLIGVHEADNAELALELAGRLIKRLDESANE